MSKVYSSSMTFVYFMHVHMIVCAGLVAIVTLKRPIMSSVLSIFIPTLLLLIIRYFCAYHIANINLNNCINILNIVTLLCSACLDMSIGSSIILNNSPSATLPKSLSKSSLTWLSKSTSPSSWCLRHCKTTLAFKEENSDHFKNSLSIYLYLSVHKQRIAFKL